MTNLSFARAIDAIPIVDNNTDRAARYPTPATNQRIQNLAAGTTQRWTGSVWTDDWASDGSQNGEAVNVRAAPYGAFGDGVHDDTAAIMAAIAAVSSSRGGTVFFPPGVYLTTGITVTDQRVDLIGSGGQSDLNGNLVQQSILSSITNAPIIKYTMAVRPNGPMNGVRYSRVADIALHGNVNAGGNQHGLHIDNRGLLVERVSASFCGGNGFHLSDSDSSLLYYTFANANKGDGYHSDDSIDYPNSSIDNNIWFCPIALANQGHGFNWVHGNTDKVFSPDVEANGGWAFLLQGSGNVRPTRQIQILGAYEGQNPGGCLSLTQYTKNNLIDFATFDVADTISDLGSNNIIRGYSDDVVPVTRGLGLWSTPAYSAGNFTASGSMTWTVQSGDVLTYIYTVIGKIMHLHFVLSGTSVGGTLSNALRIAFPLNAISPHRSIHPIYINDNGSGNVLSIAEISAGTGYLACYAAPSESTNWSASTNVTMVSGSIAFEIA